MNQIEAASSLDPFSGCITNDLCDLIIQHLDSKSLFEVSPNWSFILGQSKHFMKKNLLMIKDDVDIEDFRRTMGNSSRNYSNIYFESATLRNFSESFSILCDFGECIEELAVGAVRFNFGIVPELPNLKVLSISDKDSADFVLDLLRVNKGITTLREEKMDVALQESFCSQLVEVLKIENSIDNLEFGPSLSHFFFNYDVSECSLNLRALKLESISNVDNLIKFLRSQAATLKVLRKNAVDFAVFKIFIEEMAVLETLKVVAIYDDDGDNFSNSSTINEVHIKKISTSLLSRLLPALPSLKVFKTSHVTDEELEMIATKAHRLEKIFVAHHNLKHVKKIYKSLELNKTIKILPL